MIKNVVNGKVYIGSTTRPLGDRFGEHKRKLSKNYHENQHLQRAYNKYGSRCLQFRILSTLSNTLEREQYWTDYFESNNPTKGYNLLKKVTGYTLGHNPWNKGKNYVSTEHLKVPKTFTNEANKEASYKARGKAIRQSQLPVYVYKSSGEFIGKWRCSKDLEDYSLSNKLPIDSRFKIERMGLPTHFLASCNINKCASGKVPLYKGLKFSNLPLHQVTGEVDRTKTVNPEMGIPC